MVRGGRIWSVVWAITVLVSLGFATTVLVAWGLALWLPHRELYRQFNVVSLPHGGGRLGPLVGIHEVKRRGMVRRSWQPNPWPAPAWYQELARSRPVAWRSTAYQDRGWGRLPAVLAGGEATEQLPSGMEDARGWPWLCLWCGLEPAVIETKAAGDPVWGGIAVSGGTNAGRYRALPFWPIVPGLVGNTLVYAVAWGILLGGAWSGRYVVRTRRGRCPMCGYPGGRGTCPECGRGEVVGVRPAGGRS